MGVSDTSENNIMSEFMKTGLPSSSLERYSMYFKDVDRYYTLRELYSPRMPERVAYRAYGMTSFFNYLIELGHSPEFADDYVRFFHDSPGTNFDRNQFVYLEECCMRLSQAGVTTEKLLQDVALFLKDNGISATPDGKLNLDEIIKRNLEKEDDCKIPRKDLETAIFHMRRLLRNKHLRRHCATASNQYFMEMKVVMLVDFASNTWCRCSKVAGESSTKVSEKVIEDITLLFVLTEQVKDVYLLYD